MGIGYEVWNGQDAWFWLVISPYRNAGSIGVAANQDQAARDACLSIEEMASWRYPLAHLACTSGPRFQPSDAMTDAKTQWEAVLTRLQQYLSCMTSSIA
jgi:hypothetical protein